MSVAASHWAMNHSGENAHSPADMDVRSPFSMIVGAAHIGLIYAHYDRTTWPDEGNSRVPSARCMCVRNLARRRQRRCLPVSFGLKSQPPS